MTASDAEISKEFVRFERIATVQIYKQMKRDLCGHIVFLLQIAEFYLLWTILRSSRTTKQLRTDGCQDYHNEWESQETSKTENKSLSEVRSTKKKWRRTNSTFRIFNRTSED